MKDRQLMEQYVRRLPDKIAADVEIIEHSDVQELYHISLDPSIKEFTPFVTRRSGPAEDRTVPRISTAPTLIGCFIGYGSALADFARESDSWSGSKNRGGWYIYEFDWQVALRPKKKLLYDVGITDEVWLVNYSEATKTYKPAIIGKVFYHSVKTVALPGDKHHREVEMFLEVYDKPVWFDMKTQLKKGYWLITGPEQSNIKNFKDTKGFTFKEITKGEFMEKKKISASLLSLQW